MRLIEFEKSQLIRLDIGYSKSEYAINFYRKQKPQIIWGSGSTGEERSWKELTIELKRLVAHP